MNLHFYEGDTFMYDGEEWTIADIDHEDDEWPYECYPTKIVEKAKKIAEKEDDSYTSILYDYFVDYRECMSDFDIRDCQYAAAQKEIVNLKLEIKKLKGEK